MVVMLFGIGFLSVLTATIASLFVKTERGDETEEILAALTRLEADLAEVKRRLNAEPEVVGVTFAAPERSAALRRAGRLRARSYRKRNSPTIVLIRRRLPCLRHRTRAGRDAAGGGIGGLRIPGGIDRRRLVEGQDQALAAEEHALEVA